VPWKPHAGTASARSQIVLPRRPHLQLHLPESGARLQAGWLGQQRWGSDRAGALRLELTDFALQRYDAIFKVPQLLIHCCFIVRRGLRRGPAARHCGLWSVAERNAQAIPKSRI